MDLGDIRDRRLIEEFADLQIVSAARYLTGRELVAAVLATLG